MPAPTTTNYEEHRIVGFNELGSMDEQWRNTEGVGEILGPCLEDVIEMAVNMANRAGRVATCTVPPALQSEREHALE